MCLWTDCRMLKCCPAFNPEPVILIFKSVLCKSLKRLSNEKIRSFLYCAKLVAVSSHSVPFNSDFKNSLQSSLKKRRYFQPWFTVLRWKWAMDLLRAFCLLLLPCILWYVVTGQECCSAALNATLITAGCKVVTYKLRCTVLCFCAYIFGISMPVEYL